MAPLLSASRSFYDYVPFGANPRLMGGIRRPHQKEGENIASSEKAGKVHKGITDSERQQGTRHQRRGSQRLDHVHETRSE